jgi:hypothetical protein
MDCPICLERTTEADLHHPMQCKSTHCTFNFCMSCIESMILASKDDFEESSDGNKHVKVYLHCPNCRCDLSETIRDTLLLRKTDFLMWNKHLSEEDLTESQKRLKSVIHNEEVKKAIATARKYEQEFFESHDRAMSEEWSSFEDYDDDKQDDTLYDEDECGVEADLIQGVHQSFRFSKTHKMAEKDANLRHEMIDKTLLRGLGGMMTKGEQRKVTQLLISGDTTKLAEAAKTLHHMEQNTRTPLRKRLLSRSSIYGLIDECEKAHHQPVRRSLLRGVQQLQKLPERTSFRRRQSNVLNIENVDFMQMHPLPVRMPKYVEFEFADLVEACGFPLAFSDNGDFPVTFVDDMWDGTVRDAFIRTIIMPLTGTFKRYHPPLNHVGVLNVLSEGLLDKDLGVGRIDIKKPRIVVNSVQGAAGRCGVMQGDVVTHLNGEAFQGNAQDLVEAIRDYVASSVHEDIDEQNLSLVVNAEAPIAEALKRRGNIACWYS